MVRRHLTLGWAMLSVFVVLGLTLEALHGFKLQWYLSVANETRRFLWTLAHAHGVLLGLLNIAFALTLRAVHGTGRLIQAASGLLALGAVLMPGGFLLGGVVVYGGDPSAFIVLAPLGGALLVTAIFLAAYEFIGALRRETGVDKQA